MSELRQRQSAATSQPSTSGNTTAAQRESHRHAEREDDHGISLLDIIRVIASLILLSCGLSYYMTNSESYLWGYRPWFTRWPVVKTYLVSHPNAQLQPCSKRHSAITNSDATSERFSRSHTNPIIPLQWLRPFPPHLPGRQRIHLRRLRQQSHLRTRRELQFLHRTRRNTRLCDGLFPGRPDLEFDRR